MLLAFLIAVFGTHSAGAADEVFPEELVRFTPHAMNPLFEGAGAGHWDVKIRERGWILFDAKPVPGQPAWRMWYTGYDGTREGVKHLGYATSTDGIRWERHPANPIFTEHWIEDMMVVERDGTLFMFAEGRDDQAQLLRSSDGLKWERVGTLDVRLKDGTPIEAGPYGTPVGHFENGKWYLFYERRDAGIWLATSTDMKVWHNVQDDPVMVPGPGEYDLDLIAMNQVIRHNGRFYASIHGSKSGTKLWSSSIAVSDDLIHWKKYAGNPLFPISENKSSGVYVFDGSKYRLYTMHDQVRLHVPEGARQRPQIIPGKLR